MHRTKTLTHGPILPRIASLTLPMFFGMLSMVIFNLVDSFYVSRLGTEPLAALGFSFPVVMFVNSIALGLGIATASVVARAIGRGDHHQVKRLTTDSLILSLSIVIICVIIGLTTIGILFRFLGAEPKMVSLIKEYMRVWYVGVIFVIVPMVGNNAIRAGGNAWYPGLIMVASMIINIILDPLFIFGWGIFPRLELAGAAIATVISRALALVFSLAVLHFRQHLIDWARPHLKDFISSAKKILYIGLPSTISRILLPLTMAILTRIIAQFGHKAVAAFGVAIRIDMFVFIIIFALATALIPFVGQNWGAKKYLRVRTTCSLANKFGLFWGIFIYILFLFIGGYLGDLFSRDPLVSNNINYYLRIVPVGYGFQGIIILTASMLNAVNKPFISLGLNAARLLLMYIPFAFIGGVYYGLVGVFAGLAFANIVAGIVSLIVERKQITEVGIS